MCDLVIFKLKRGGSMRLGQPTHRRPVTNVSIVTGKSYFILIRGLPGGGVGEGVGGSLKCITYSLLIPFLQMCAPLPGHPLTRIGFLCQEQIRVFLLCCWNSQKSQGILFY